MVASVRYFGQSRSNGLAPCSVYIDDVTVFSIVFSFHTRKQRFQKASFFNGSTLESVFEWLRSVIVFGVVVWTIDVSGAKQLRYPMKTDRCGQGLSFFSTKHIFPPKNLIRIIFFQAKSSEFILRNIVNSKKVHFPKFFKYQS